MTTDDPFERAARREELAELQRQRRSEMRKRYGSGGTGTMVRFFVLPYVVWGLLRASNHAWGDPTLGSSIVEFFFGAVGFGFFTGFMLLMMWMWMMEGRKKS